MKNSKNSSQDQNHRRTPDSLVPAIHSPDKAVRGAQHLMNTQRKWEAYLNLIKREVVPAFGCTDPIAIALAAAKTRELLAQIPERIDVTLSRNMLKNAMGSEFLAQGLPAWIWPPPWACLAAMPRPIWKC